MTSEQLVRHLKSQPFVPFQMHLADGRVLNVDHPELLLYIPGTRTSIYADMRDKEYDTVDLLLITSLRTRNRRRNGVRRHRRG